jgi:hypothetical protein
MLVETFPGTLSDAAGTAGFQATKVKRVEAAYGIRPDASGGEIARSATADPGLYKCSVVPWAANPPARSWSNGD